MSSWEISIYGNYLLTITLVICAYLYSIGTAMIQALQGCMSPCAPSPYHTRAGGVMLMVGGYRRCEGGVGGAGGVREMWGVRVV